ncbi:MAG TPA: DUF1175 family protein [Pyrinomonadaceae bacterium]|nr:DUF1175 family protein [Pyrinomonadaceae bacterium]
MFGLAKPTPGLALLILIPAFLILSYFSLARSTGAPAHAPRPSATRPEPEPDVDVDHDGLPDNVELRTFNDRENFRRWFTWVAEMQFYNLSDEWHTEQRDCAGLVRFAWREALRPHDRPWFQRMGENYDPVAPDLTANIAAPLGGKLFRTAPGTYMPTDVAEGRFSEFADAQTLKLFNVDFVSRDRNGAKPGDLLFFHQPWVQKFPFHMMIFLGEPRVASEGTHDWVVYHTGASPNDAGTVKKVRLAVLDQHPDKRWRPISSNPNFLGFYRLKILNQPVTPEE